MCRSTAEIGGSPLSDGALGRRTAIYRRVSGFLCLGIASALRAQSGGTRGTDRAFSTSAGRARPGALPRPGTQDDSAARIPVPFGCSGTFDAGARLGLRRELKARAARSEEHTSVLPS